jgi:amino-acid N-acetyltransferase
MSDSFTIVQAAGAIGAQVIDLLSENGLPVDDLASCHQLLALLYNRQLAATAGFEMLDDCALLRSLSVQQALRGRGLAKKMVGEIEDRLRKIGITRIYLLTTTAGEFFQKLGFVTVPRVEAPNSIRQTRQFAELCPASSLLMQKNIL